MTTTDTVIWTGRSGTRYTYQVFGLDTNWYDVPGNYIFVRGERGGWVVIYIGQTSSFKNRIPNHEVWPCAILNGVTHIHAHTNSNGEQARLAEEADLKAAYRELC